MSWGGPSDEFRIYTNDQNEIEYIEYWYMDWFDGASIIVKNKIIYQIIKMLLIILNKMKTKENLMKTMKAMKIFLIM